MVSLKWVSQRTIGDDLVSISSSYARSSDVAIRNEVGDDRLRCSFGNANSLSDISTSDLGVVGETDEDVTVIGEEGPSRAFILRCRGRFLHSIDRRSKLLAKCKILEK